VRRNAALLAALESLRQDRYVLVAQFDFPHGGDALVSGDWPFADGTFALFGREPFQGPDWRWYWSVSDSRAVCHPLHAAAGCGLGVGEA
jgi:hypothetical protein